ncbi:NAD(P)/FAD-dependent oxidoreductase [Nitrogeniibacter aestuarii]|uniref:NAD(P)/FAD-dependent oxidoreductase n=1 Tax=Nitrogeniibacter aestuarii TaxID=2815343 RepID=UPI001D0F7292|nr:FAD-dependent oxidoreductase [Nitrogeniibacter aestuarii]
MKHVILGNGPAGVVAAEALRAQDKDCEILMVGCEGLPPYSRMAIPYLLEENIDEHGTYLRKKKGHFEALRIDQKNARAASVDATKKMVHFADNSVESYDRLLIATGSHPVRPPIPGLDLPQVQNCWTLEDARAIAKLTKPGSRVVQLGAGFIGCIIMEALAKRGVELTVVEMGDRMVPRMMTPKAGGMIKQWVEEKGIRVRTEAKVEKIEPVGAAPAAQQESSGFFSKLVNTLTGGGSKEAPSAPAAHEGPVSVTLSTGEVLEVDVVIVAAGVKPNIDFLEGTGVKVEGGVIVDAGMRTNVADIYAAGDVAAGLDFFTGEPMVSAIQPNAADQARVAAVNMTGGNTELPGVLAINVLDTLGLISTSFGQWWGDEDGDSVELVEESKYRYISLQFKGDVLIGATSIGRTDHVGALRGLIQGRQELGEWKQRLMENPAAFYEAYIAVTQPTALARNVA